MIPAPRPPNLLKDGSRGEVETGVYGNLTWKNAGDLLIPVWDGLGQCFSDFINTHTNIWVFCEYCRSWFSRPRMELRFCITGKLPDAPCFWSVGHSLRVERDGSQTWLRIRIVWRAFKNQDARPHSWPVRSGFFNFFIADKGFLVGASG